MFVNIIICVAYEIFAFFKGNKMVAYLTGYLKGLAEGDFKSEVIRLYLTILPLALFNLYYMAFCIYGFFYTPYAIIFWWIIFLSFLNSLIVKRLSLRNGIIYRKVDSVISILLLLYILYLKIYGS